MITKRQVTGNGTSTIHFVSPFEGNVTADAPQCDKCTWVYRHLDGQFHLKYFNNWCSVRHG